MTYSILDYLRDQNQSVQSFCNGLGICGKCKVIVNPIINPVPLEQKLLSEDELKKGVRLACMHEMDDGLTIKVFDRSDMKIESKFTSNYSKHPYTKLITKKKTFKVIRRGEIVGSVSDNKLYGIAIDIGTTTVVVALVNLISHRVVGLESFSNPQKLFGADVISRIQYGSQQKGLAKLNQLLMDRLDGVIQSLLIERSTTLDYLYEVVISANSTMNHIVLMKDPSGLAKAPYTSSIKQTLVRPYNDLFKSKCLAEVTLIGDADAYVGGDIISGIFASKAYLKKGYTLYVDLGTNGEIALIHSKRILATSVAAGPAFEGVNIQCGMGATKGAIASFEDVDNYTTIFNAPAIGICGSGLIDIMVFLRKNKWIEDTGRMKKSFYINEDVYLNQLDVREFQLAKSAIRTGIQLLMQESHVDVTEISEIIISGGFGSYINIDHLFELQILPEAFKNKTHSIGNASLSGAIKYLMSSSKDIQDILNKTRVINLSHLAVFQEIFIHNLSFKTK